MEHRTRQSQEQAAAEHGTQDEPHDTFTKDCTISHRTPHAATKQRKRAVSTPKQLAANRANAACSTGPRTMEGKEITARNAIKHGLASRSVLLPGDDPGKYETFADDMKISWGPQGRQEQELVEQIINNANWHLRRIQKMKAGALRSLTRENVDPVTFVDLWDLVTEKFNRYAAGRAGSALPGDASPRAAPGPAKNSPSAAQLTSRSGPSPHASRALREAKFYYEAGEHQARPDARPRIAITAHSQRG